MISRGKLGKWESRSANVVSVYRILAFAVGIAEVFLDPSHQFLTMPPLILLASIGGLYILITAFYPFGWYTGVKLYIVLGLDLVLGILLMIATGGLHSPFLLFTLSPVVMTALFSDIRLAATVALLSGGYVIACHLLSPFFPTEFTGADVGFLLVYLMTAGLVTALPYLINVNVRQQLRYNNILRERQRLSREIHDGAAQTATALRWQIQLLQRSLAEKGIEMNEAKELEKLAEKALLEARESLELLRNYTGDGSLLPHLKDYLEHLRQETNIEFHLDMGDALLRLGAVAELELLRICQEALANVRKHSLAKHVRITIKPVGNRINVTIADDGQGFDMASFYRGGARVGCHGLSVMEERAKSVGGKFRVISVPGKGTEVQVEVPTETNRNNAIWEK